MTASVNAPWLVGQPSSGELGDRTTRDVFAQATRVIASITVVGLGVEKRIGYGATAALPLAIILLPFWLRFLRQYKFATLLTGLAALAVVSGVVLSELAKFDHVVSSPNRLQAIGLLGSGIGAFGLLLWAGSLLPLARIVMLYGAGSLASTIAYDGMSWKYNLAVPTTLVVLGALEGRRRGLLPAIAVLVLGVIGVADDARSYFAVCVLAATITIWQLRPSANRGPRVQHRWFTMLLLGGLVLAVYFFFSSLATSGVLGTEVEARTNAQITNSGSLIAGGRPEWAATREIFKLHPAGYGAGVVPNWSDRIAGETGLASINVHAGGYADHYMFGHEFELHSVAADLWVRFGWPGVALALAIAFVIVRNLSFLISARQAPTYLAFSCILALWYMLFGPFYSNWLDVCVPLALVTVAAGPRPASSVADRASR
jgi:hypothetical protein